MRRSYDELVRKVVGDEIRQIEPLGVPGELRRLRPLLFLGRQRREDGKQLSPQK